MAPGKIEVKKYLVNPLNTSMLFYFSIYGGFKRDYTNIHMTTFILISNRELQQSLANAPVGVAPTPPKHHDGESIYHIRFIIIKKYSSLPTF